MSSSRLEDRSRLRRARLAAVAGASVLAVSVFSGCGSETVRNQAHPGAAVVVGEERISLDDVDDLARRYCALYLKANGEQAQALPMQVLRNDSAQILTDAEVARQFAAAEGLDVGATRAWLLDQAKQAGSQYGLSGEQLEDFAEISAQVDARATYLVAGGQQAPITDQAAGQQALARGNQRVAAWAEELQIELDPRFARPTAEGYAFNAGSLARPVSDIAKAIEALNGEQPDPAYVESLPPSQRCSSM